jgi:hypothetical protein
MRAWWRSAAAGAVIVGAVVNGFAQTKPAVNTIAGYVAAAHASRNRHRG